MSKFKVGNKVKQISSGYGTDPSDTGKEGIVTEIGLTYIDVGDGINIKTIGDWECKQNIRGEKAFVLAETDWDE